MPSTVVQKLLLAVSIFLIVAGLVLTISGVFSPAWQVVDIREFRAEHQHGLWWDCIRAEKHVVAVGDFYDEAPLHCMYKFDESAALVIENTLNRIDEDGAAGEAEHHRFWGWHKVLLSLIIISQLGAFVAMCTGVCAPCFPPTTFCFAISLFIAMLLSMLADGIFFFYANRVDVRFVTGMVGTYEQVIGYAFYLHMGGTLCWVFAFLCAIATTYKFLTSDGQQSPSAHHRQFRPVPPHFDAQRHQQTPLLLGASPKKALRTQNNGQFAYNGGNCANANANSTRMFRETSA
ncbi:hypothetical protein GPALN_012474 [Globodera pallida]|uniref:Clc-like protein n=1 Tax=Globodera pallida TaxID=36090 RepID=A0A183BRS0_GLOPA|nr:hypothetical protein GPALN_012474 [Globodera pallida]